MNDWPTKKVTTTLIIFTIFVWGIWDLVPYLTEKPGDTESEVILQFFVNYPSTAYAFGFLAGHWVWPKKDPFEWPQFVWGLGVGVSLFVVDVVASVLHPDFLPLFFLTGFVAGHYLWGLERPQ